MGEKTFEDVLARIERREQTARRRAVLYSLVPIAMAVVVLGYTAYQKGQIFDLEGELKDAKARLQEATDLQRYVHPIDLVDTKLVASRYPQEARALTLILTLRRRGVEWHLGGQSPTRGFDSPSFAAYILRELNLPGGDVRPGETLLETSRRLWDRLPPTQEPRVGDLVFYPAGYVLFYFVDVQMRPFVIGMTPFGITALKPDFAESRGYRRPWPGS